MQEELTVTIMVNGELANYYFDHWGYTHRLLESPSYPITARFKGLSSPISDVITIIKNDRDWKDTVADLGGRFCWGYNSCRGCRLKSNFTTICGNIYYWSGNNRIRCKTSFYPHLGFGWGTFLRNYYSMGE